MGCMMKGRGSLRRSRDERGAAAVEFALIAMIMLGLVLAVIQLSIWFWAYQVGGHAAREGARVAAVEPCTDAPAQTRAVARIGTAASNTPVVGVTRADTDGNSGLTVGDEITVNVTFSFHPIGPLSSILPAIDKSATARVENIPAGGC
jgi:Flp pilus assembly protein TadG